MSTNNHLDIRTKLSQQFPKGSLMAEQVETLEAYIQMLEDKIEGLEEIWKKSNEVKGKDREAYTRSILASGYCPGCLEPMTYGVCGTPHCTYDH